MYVYAYIFIYRYVCVCIYVNFIQTYVFRYIFMYKSRQNAYVKVENASSSQTTQWKNLIVVPIKSKVTFSSACLHQNMPGQMFSI